MAVVENRLRKCGQKRHGSIAPEALQRMDTIHKKNGPGVFFLMWPSGSKYGCFFGVYLCSISGVLYQSAFFWGFLVAFCRKLLSLQSSYKQSTKKPSWELTYPLRRHFWKWLPLPKVGYVSSLLCRFQTHVIDIASIGISLRGASQSHSPCSTG